MRPTTYNDSGNRRTIPQQQNRNQQIMTQEATTPEELLKDIRATEPTISPSIYVAPNVKSLYFCGYGRSGLHKQDCLIANKGIVYLVLYG